MLSEDTYNHSFCNILKDACMWSGNLIEIWIHDPLPPIKIMSIMHAVYSLVVAYGPLSEGGPIPARPIGTSHINI